MNSDITGTTRRTSTHYGFIVVACCCLIMGVNIGVAFSCAGIFYQPVCQSIGSTVGEFGIYMSIMYVASSLLLPSAGKMIERYSARYLLSGSSVVMGLTLLWMAVSEHLWQFYVAGAMLGFTVAFLLYLSFPTLINRWFHTKVGLLMGICSAASGIGGMGLNLLAGWMILHYGWHWAYAAFGGLIIVIVSPLLFIFLRDYPSDKGLKPYGYKAVSDNAPMEAAGGISYGEAKRMPVFYGIVVFAFLMMACSTLNLFIPKYVQALDFDLSQAALTATCVMAGVTIGKLALGHINDRNCLVGVLVTTGFGIGGLVMLIVGQLGLWALLAGAFLFGWAYAGVTVQTTMLTRSVFGSRDYAPIYAVVSIGLAAGGAVASGGWGLIADATSFRCIFWIGVVMLVLSAILGLWALACRRPSKSV